MSEWKLTGNGEKAPKSSIMGKSKAKPKKAGSRLGGAKKVNVNLEKLEKESGGVAAEQAREKQFAAARLASGEAGVDQTTKIDNKPMSQERRNQNVERLGMGGGTKKLVVSSHMLDFHEIRQIEPSNVKPSTTVSSSLADPSSCPPIQSAPSTNSSYFTSSSKPNFARTQQSSIYENSDDISDLLKKSQIGDTTEGVEYDQHGLVTK